MEKKRTGWRASQKVNLKSDEVRESSRHNRHRGRPHGARTIARSIGAGRLRCEAGEAKGELSRNPAPAPMVARSLLYELVHSALQPPSSRHRHILTLFNIACLIIGAFSLILHYSSRFGNLSTS